MSDLFNPEDRAHARRTDPKTSHRTADAVTPALGTIRNQVEAFAFRKGERGFIDEELSAAFEATDKSSYRTRRAELTSAGTILDSGRTKPNSDRRQCVIWVHKSFHALPALQASTPQPDARTRENAQRVVAICEKWARQMRAEGRHGGELAEAADLARAWTL